MSCLHYTSAVVKTGTSTPPRARFRRNVRGFYAWLGALLCAGVGPVAAVALVRVGSLPARLGAVALGTLAWVPLILVMVAILRHGDEFVRRLHLIAMSIAFAGALVLITLLDWLVRADFIEPPDLAVVWLAIAILWWLSLFATKRFFERQP